MHSHRCRALLLHLRARQHNAHAIAVGRDPAARTRNRSRIGSTVSAKESCCRTLSGRVSYCFNIHHCHRYLAWYAMAPMR